MGNNFLSSRFLLECQKFRNSDNLKIRFENSRMSKIQTDRKSTWHENHKLQPQEKSF